MADDERKRIEEAKKAKQAEMERKRAEVRKRMEEASKAKKAKKGFMTPERKKKLRLLLRKKAAEELKREQERKQAERRRVIEQRCGTMCDLENANEDELKDITKQYFERMYLCESQKWDLEHEVRKRDYEISDLNSQVNDLRGKFIKPTLKKVSKYENKFAKLQKKAAEFNFRNQLKTVKKKEFTLEEEDKEKKGIVDWSKKDEKKQEEEEEEEDETEEGQTETEASRAASPDVLTEASSIPQDDQPPTASEDAPAPAEPSRPQTPPPPPTPPKTEEDLWMFLREAVTSANPLSIDELKKKLVDTAESIPQTYLEPVVVASIKRSQSQDQLSQIESLPGDDAAKEGAPATQVVGEGEVKPADGATPVAEGQPPTTEGTAPVDGQPSTPGTTPATEGAPGATPGEPGAVVSPAPAGEQAPPAEAPASTPETGTPAPAESAPVTISESLPAEPGPAITASLQAVEVSDEEIADDEEAVVDDSPHMTKKHTKKPKKLKTKVPAASEPVMTKPQPKAPSKIAIPAFAAQAGKGPVTPAPPGKSGAKQLGGSTGAKQTTTGSKPGGDQANQEVQDQEEVFEEEEDVGDDEEEQQTQSQRGSLEDTSSVWDDQPRQQSLGQTPSGWGRDDETYTEAANDYESSGQDSNTVGATKSSAANATVSQPPPPPPPPVRHFSIKPLPVQPPVHGCKFLYDSRLLMVKVSGSGWHDFTQDLLIV